MGGRLIFEVSAVIPCDWLNAARAAHMKALAGTITRPGIADALAVMLPRLGWRLTDVGGKERIILLKRLTV